MDDECSEFISPRDDNSWELEFLARSKMDEEDLEFVSPREMDNAWKLEFAPFHEIDKALDLDMLFRHQAATRAKLDKTLGAKAAQSGLIVVEDDHAVFDRAFETNDLDAYVYLFPSQQPVSPFKARAHPWAQTPKTVGALACSQIAFLASEASRAGEQQALDVKDRIRQAGALGPLVEFLKSDAQDRADNAVVALSFLTTACSANVKVVYEAGAMELLIPHLESHVAGMRSATSTALRNIYTERAECRTRFVDLGGIRGLVANLDALKEPVTPQDQLDAQLEALLNLQDVIDEESMLAVQEAVNAGALNKLEALMEVEDEDVRSTAWELFETLTA